jgi:uncharacterized OB-fold protein
MDKNDVTRKLPAPAPFVSPETAPFWSAAKEGRLILPFCMNCQHPIWYPKRFCGGCGSRDIEWRQVSGAGEIYSFSQVYRGEGDYRDVGSFVLALVDLDEGVRVLTNIVDAAPADLKIGQRVSVVFHDAGADAALPRFTPAQ